MEKAERNARAGELRPSFGGSGIAVRDRASPVRPVPWETIAIRVQEDEPMIQDDERSGFGYKDRIYLYTLSGDLYGSLLHDKLLDDDGLKVTLPLEKLQEPVWRRMDEKTAKEIPATKATKPASKLPKALKPVN